MKLEKLFISLIILSLPSLSLGQKKAYILLISIDGYRWDYTEIHNPKFLTEFKKNGLSAKSLIPVFPSHTFPNHLSIITGSTSTEHGIVSNNFYAPDLNKHFSISNPLSLTDHSFYKAQPIWSLAEKEGVKTGMFFWPGSDLILNSHRSSYYKKFNHETKNKEKIDQIINWFKLPKQERPQFVATYFNEIDLVGEMFGPESMETKRAIKQLDLEIERLVTSLKKLNLNLYVFIVSDHGMMKLNENNFELIIKNNYQKKLIENFIIKDLGTHMHLYTKQKLNIDKIKNSLNKTAKNFRCHTKHLSEKETNSKRFGDILCTANPGWIISHKKRNTIPKAFHGWSPMITKEMHGIFYAQGERIKKGEISSFENRHLFSLFYNLLRLDNFKNQEFFLKNKVLINKD